MAFEGRMPFPLKKRGGGTKKQQSLKVALALSGPFFETDFDR